MNNSANHTASGAKMVWTAMLIIVVASAIMAALPYDVARPWIREGGLFETLSAFGYIACIVAVFVFWGGKAAKMYWYIPIVLALFAARELDLDKHFFTEGLLRSRQYIGDTVALPERIWATVILLGIVATIVVLLRRETGGFLRGIKNGRPAVFATIIAIVLMAFTKSIDGIGRKLEPFGILVSEKIGQMAIILEEVGETGIPLMFGVAISLSKSTRSRT